MASVVSLEKNEIIRSKEFMLSKAKIFEKKEIILGPKTAILGPQFCRILVLGLIFGGQGAGPGPLAPLDLTLPFQLNLFFLTPVHHMKMLQNCYLIIPQFHVLDKNATLMPLFVCIHISDIAFRCLLTNLQKSASELCISKRKVWLR